MFRKKEGKYWREKVKDSRGNSRKLWQTLAEISNSSKSVSTEHTAEDVARFFSKKVEDIRTETSSAKPRDIVPTASKIIDSFSLVTTEDVVDLPKTCDLDPSRLIKENGGTVHYVTFQQVAGWLCLPGFIQKDYYNSIAEKVGLDIPDTKNFNFNPSIAYQPALPALLTPPWRISKLYQHC